MYGAFRRNRRRCNCIHLRKGIFEELLSYSRRQYFSTQKDFVFSLIFSPLFESNLCSNWPCFYLSALCQNLKPGTNLMMAVTNARNSFMFRHNLIFFFNYNSLFWAKLVFTLQWYLRRNTFICNNICDNGILVENKKPFLRLTVIACCIINEASLMTFRSYRHD